ncbi:BCCT family transporter [Desulforhopalus sp. 52FAK]
MNALARARKEAQFPVLIPPVVVLSAIIMWGLVDLEGFGTFAQEAIVYIRTTFASGFMWTGIIATGFLGWVCFTRAGDHRIGGKDAKPEFSCTSWFAMSLCACIAIGILFWGVAEPMYHWMGPPKGAGLEGGSAAAAVLAMRKTNLHWCLTPFALHLTFGVGVAYMLISRNRPIQLRYMFTPVFGEEKLNGPLGYAFESLFIFSYVAAISPSLVFGAQQISGGLNFMAGIPNTFTTSFLVVLAITATYTISSCTGLKRGVKVLSSVNYYVYLVLMAFILIVGPTKFIADIFTQGFGEYLQNFLSDSFYTDALNESDGWVGGWTAFYWCWWITAGPVTGAFVARVSVGRTLRQMIIMYVGIGSVFSAIWMAIFGGTAIYFDMNNAAGIWTLMNEKGVEIATFSFLNNLPLAAITIPVFLFACYVSFTTNMDSGTTTLAYMTCGTHAEDGEPPILIKITWGLLLGGVGLVLLALNTMKATQSLAVATGLIVSVVLILLVFTIGREMLREASAEKE